MIIIFNLKEEEEEEKGVGHLEQLDCHSEVNWWWFSPDGISRRSKTIRRRQLDLFVQSLNESNSIRNDRDEGQRNYIYISERWDEIWMRELLPMSMHFSLSFFLLFTINKNTSRPTEVHIDVEVWRCGSGDVYIRESERREKRRRKGGQMTRMSVSGGQKAIIHLSLERSPEAINNS